MKSRMLKNVDRMLRSLPFPALLLCAAYAGGAPDCARLVLQDVAADAGIDFRHQRGASDRKHLPETMGSGLAWLDFDQDGLLDLYVVQSGPFPPDGSDAASNRLFRNLGDGTFEDVTSQSGAAGRGYGQGVVGRRRQWRWSDRPLRRELRSRRPLLEHRQRPVPRCDEGKLASGSAAGARPQRSPTPTAMAIWTCT